MLTVTFNILLLFISCFHIKDIVTADDTKLVKEYGTSNISKYELLHYLLNETRYDASIPPGYISGNTTKVYVNIIIQDVRSENEKNMEFSCLMYIRMHWTDDRLNYMDNSTYNVVKISGSYVNRVWIPDIYFHQERDSKFPGFIGKNELIYIERNGSIRYSGRIYTTLQCQMDLTVYPYDKQFCPITIQSYTYNKDDVQLYWQPNNPVIIYGGNVEDVPLWRNGSYDSPYDDADGNYSILNTGIQIKRMSYSYSQYISTPLVLVSIAMMSFFFGDNFTPRVALSGASMTTIIMHWAGIYNKIQPAAALIWLDRWMLSNLCFVGGIILFTAVIHHVKHPKEIAEFKHLMEESISIQLKNLRHHPKWSEVKSWKHDLKSKGKHSPSQCYDERETSLDNSLLVSVDNELNWTVDRRFYAVQNDELREKYYREFAENMEKERSHPFWKFYNICRHYSRRFILDVIAFAVFLLSYICFASIYVYTWQKEAV